MLYLTQNTGTLKTWTSNEVLTASDLNGNFTDMLSTRDDSTDAWLNRDTLLQRRAAFDDSFDAGTARLALMYKAAFGDSADAWLARDVLIMLRAAMGDSVDAWRARTALAADSTDITDGSISGADLRIDVIDSTKVRNASVSGADLSPVLNLQSKTVHMNAITNNTADGADNGYVNINGGGATGDLTRGSFVYLFGNEYSGNTGTAWMTGGNPAGTGVSDIFLQLYGGYLCVGGSSAGTTTLDVQSDLIRIRTTKTPLSGGAGNAGEICWDAGWLYVCTATNTWERIGLTGGY